MSWNDGRWIAEALELLGVMCYGTIREEAIRKVERLAIEVIADLAPGVADGGRLDDYLSMGNVPIAIVVLGRKIPGSNTLKRGL